MPMYCNLTRTRIRRRRCKVRKDFEREAHHEDGMRWQLMWVLLGSCGRVQKKLRLCIVVNKDFAVSRREMVAMRLGREWYHTA